MALSQLPFWIGTTVQKMPINGHRSRFTAVTPTLAASTSLFGETLVYRVNLKNRTIQQRPPLNHGAQARYDDARPGEPFEYGRVGFRARPPLEIEEYSALRVRSESDPNSFKQTVRNARSGYRRDRLHRRAAGRTCTKRVTKCGGFSMVCALAVRFPPGFINRPGDISDEASCTGTAWLRCCISNTLNQ